MDHTELHYLFAMGIETSHKFSEVTVPRFRCATLECSDQTIWVTHWWRGVTQNTWSGKRLGRTMVWTMVALRSDQRAKSGKWSGQWSRYGLIRGQSRTIV